MVPRSRNLDSVLVYMLCIVIGRGTTSDQMDDDNYTSPQNTQPVITTTESSIMLSQLEQKTAEILISTSSSPSVPGTSEISSTQSRKTAHTTVENVAAMSPSTGNSWPTSIPLEINRDNSEPDGAFTTSSTFPSPSASSPFVASGTDFPMGHTGTPLNPAVDSEPQSTRSFENSMKEIIASLAPSENIISTHDSQTTPSTPSGSTHFSPLSFTPSFPRSADVETSVSSSKNVNRTSTAVSTEESSTAQGHTTAPKLSTEDRYFVVIKSDDCPTLKANKFDRELSRALSALGVLNVTADISQTECQTMLNVNITATAPYSAIRLLEDSKKHNLTITIFNRTFKVVDIQKLENGSKDFMSGSTPSVINVVTKREFNAYVAVGVCFGVVLLVCILVCCMKMWSKVPGKRLSALRRSHTPLKPEDYTLTPIPRPTSLYVDYCRNSFSGDVYSTTSAGSVASTSPIAEKGVVQPFEASIVPLEDTVIPGAAATSRKNSIECLPPRDLKPLHVNTVSGQGISSEEVHERERMNPRPFDYARTVGLTNPTYLRY